MQENYVLVQQGFRILLSAMSGYIGQTMSKKYSTGWWREVLYSVPNPGDLPSTGNYSSLVDSLDILNCLQIIDRKWAELYIDKLPKDCRTWAIELKGVRNAVSHIGQQDMEQPDAERALNTMELLCRVIDPESADEINKIYKEVRSRADDSRPVVAYTGLAQPESDSKRGPLAEGSLLKLDGSDKVQKTTMTRKITYGGKTVVYPVYKVRLDCLYYNDQNDRIATWITQYESDNGENSLTDLNKSTFNSIIESFIYDSNSDAIDKTQKNISMVGQREPGVTLADGRVVDGNRRFTCLRRLQREDSEPLYFETVIMDMDILEDRKQIKLLELAIQHGEEKKVDYDLIDYAIGTYRDTVQTNLLTVEEYAASANEPVSEVKKRIEIAGIICEFLEHLKLPEQYHVARDYQVYSVFQEMMAPLNKVEGDDKTTLKTIAFNNAMMKAIPDQRKFIRDIKSLVKADSYAEYFEEQKELSGVIKERFEPVEIHSKADVDKFAEDNSDIADSLRQSMADALIALSSLTDKNKPAANIAKSIALLTEVDSRLFERMEADEKEDIRTGLDELGRIVATFKELLDA